MNPTRKDPQELAAKIEQQKKEARAPKRSPGSAGPKPTPPESGKPVWDKPHSS